MGIRVQKRKIRVQKRKKNKDSPDSSTDFVSLPPSSGKHLSVPINDGKSSREFSIHDLAKNPNDGRGKHPNSVAARKKYASPQFSSENQPKKRGRPVGSVSLTTVLKKCLQNYHRNSEDKTVADAIVESLVRQARYGDVRAIQTVFERVDGKVPDRIIDETPEEKARKALAAIQAMDAADSGEISGNESDG